MSMVTDLLVVVVMSTPLLALAIGLGILRAGYDGARRDGVDNRPDLTQTAVGKQVGKDRTFISAADIYNSLNPEQQVRRGPD